jgi:glycyl-tRNA synthetase beta chain
MANKTPAKAAAAKSADFLLDVHTEPLPARFVAPALEQMKAGIVDRLKGKLVHGDVSVCGTLRHLVVRVDGLEARSSDALERFKGPKEQVWRKPDGSFTPAAEGFARKYGVMAADLKPIDGVLYAEVEKKGETAVVVLQKLVPDLLASLQFPKFMTWEESGFKFGRPIRAITALYGKSVVPLSVAGVESSQQVYGHPTYAAKPVAIDDPSAHAAALKKAHVIADPAERRKALLAELEKAGAKAGGDVDLDEALVDETVFMTETPAAVVGELKPEHLELPEALLKMVMKKQLKFFPVLRRGGRLAPAFVGVRDGLHEGDELVKVGYRRVLEARFNDAAFFFGRDCARTLESRLPELERVTYQKTLGSMSDKAARVSELAAWVASALKGADAGVVAAAARLVYADLVTDVVKEFPELQGTMGGVYARRDGLGDAAATAIEQFYFPIGAGSAVPETAEAAIVSLAGKLDGLAGCFAAGLIPTGSADPFALRRQALGAVRILAERDLPLDLDAALAQAVSLQPAKAEDPAKLAAQLGDFVWTRAESYFEEQGFKADEIRAFRRGDVKLMAEARPVLEAIRDLRRDPAFEPLAAVFKRASNILNQAKFDATGVSIDGGLKDEADRGLHEAYAKAERLSRAALDSRDYAAALKSLVSIKPQLDEFFDKVMVMVDDRQVREQRLALLAKIVGAFRRVADLSEIQSSAS